MMIDCPGCGDSIQKEEALCLGCWAEETSSEPPTLTLNQDDIEFPCRDCGNDIEMCTCPCSLCEQEEWLCTCCDY